MLCFYVNITAGRRQFEICTIAGKEIGYLKSKIIIITANVKMAPLGGEGRTGRATCAGPETKHDVFEVSDPAA